MRSLICRRVFVIDTFLVPEIFQDNRSQWLKNLPSRTSARRVAIFHDAITWRRPNLASAKRQNGFADYMSTLGSFDEVIAVSEEAANDLRAFWGDAVARIEISGWPVDDQFRTPPAEPPVLSGKERPNILCVELWSRERII